MNGDFAEDLLTPQPLGRLDSLIHRPSRDLALKRTGLLNGKERHPNLGLDNLRLRWKHE